MREAELQPVGGNDHSEAVTEDDGGLKRHPTLEEQAISQIPEQNLDVLSLLDDDTDNLVTGRGADPLKILSPVQLAHEMTRGADDELKI
jgi:hypothetical protein